MTITPALLFLDSMQTPSNKNVINKVGSGGSLDSLGSLSYKLPKLPELPLHFMFRIKHRMGRMNDLADRLGDSLRATPIFVTAHV